MSSLVPLGYVELVGAIERRGGSVRFRKRRDGSWQLEVDLFGRPFRRNPIGTWPPSLESLERHLQGVLDQILDEDVDVAQEALEVARAEMRLRASLRRLEASLAEARRRPTASQLRRLIRTHRAHGLPLIGTGQLRRSLPIRESHANDAAAMQATADELRVRALLDRNRRLALERLWEEALAEGDATPRRPVPGSPPARRSRRRRRD